MKKFLPFTIFILAFSGFITTQIIWDIFHLKAEQATLEDSRSTQYQSLFREMSLKATDGEQIRLSGVKAPIVILNFWASWCLPCLKEFPSLVELQNKYKQQVLIIGINGDEQDALKEIDKMSKKFSFNFKNVIDDKSLVGDKFFVNSYPFSIVFSKGKVIFTSQKTMNFMDSAFIELIDKSLK